MKTKNKENIVSQNYTNFSRNQELITNAVINYLTDSKGRKVPSYREIAEITGLHFNTVLNHYKNLKFEPQKAPQRALTPLVINNLFILSGKNSAASKLWFQIMEGWTEEQKLNIDMKLGFDKIPELSDL